MKKIDLKNQVKTIILEKWLTMTLNKKCYGHPLVVPPNMGANLTSFERHEPLFHIKHKLLHQNNED